MYKMLYHINKFADIAGSIMKMSEMVITLIQHNYQVFSLGKCAMILPTETDRRESITVYAAVVYLTQTSSW